MAREKKSVRCERGRVCWRATANPGPRPGPPRMVDYWRKDKLRLVVDRLPLNAHPSSPQSSRFSMSGLTPVVFITWWLVNWPFPFPPSPLLLLYYSTTPVSLSSLSPTHIIVFTRLSPLSKASLRFHSRPLPEIYRLTNRSSCCFSPDLTLDPRGSNQPAGHPPRQ